MSTNHRKKLSDVLSNAQALAKIWASTEAAGDLSPLPPGEYRARILSGELFESKSGTPGYKLHLEVVDGDHAGRRLWHDVWLTAAAMAMAKRDLGKLGITELTQLEKPLPQGILLDVRVVIRENDSGDRFNAVRGIAAAGVEQGDPFRPFGDDEDADDDQDDGDDGDDAAATDEGGKPKGPAGPPAGKNPLRGKAVDGPYGAGGDRR